VAVLGAVPRIKGGGFPERHMGLIPPREHPEASRAVEEVASIVERYVDVDRLCGIAQRAPVLSFDDPGVGEKERFDGPSRRPRIGLIRDSAFWFYYPDNLEVLEELGASLVECSALNDRELPAVDALYIGGGFPETHAESLAANAGFRKSLREAVEAGLPVYAECGGLMYLGKDLMVADMTYPMAGVFPLRFVLDARPQGHGYTILEVDSPNPYFPMGDILHGHEFHYSHIPDLGEGRFAFAFDVKRGQGIHGRRDGLCYKNVLATYSHLHAAGAKGWAKALLEQAIHYRKNKSLENAAAVTGTPTDKDIPGNAKLVFPTEFLSMQP
jgi:cobyrinic acid a,c-diamide synthase